MQNYNCTRTLHCNFYFILFLFYFFQLVLHITFIIIYTFSIIIFNSLLFTIFCFLFTIVHYFVHKKKYLLSFNYCEKKPPSKPIKLHYYRYTVMLKTISNDSHTYFHVLPVCSI